MFLMQSIRVYNAAMTRNLDLALLRAFVAVAETGSMTAAANALNLTQGAVSQQIRRLEDLLGMTLFDRGRALAQTRAGERLLGDARRLIALNDQILREMAGEVCTGRVRLGVPWDLVGTRLPAILKAYAQAWPEVEISLHCAASPELAHALAAREVDLALIEYAADQATGECLAVEPLVWAGARGGHAYRRRPLPLSMVSDRCVFRSVLFGALEQRGIPWRTVFEDGSIEATSATVRTDLAVTAWLASTVPPDLEILDSASGLPALPAFAITLHVPASGASTASREMARHVREGFLRGQLRAA